MGEYRGILRYFGAVVVILATVADYVFPAIFAQKFKCSTYSQVRLVRNSAELAVVPLK